MGESSERAPRDNQAQRGARTHAFACAAHAPPPLTTPGMLTSKDRSSPAPAEKKRRLPPLDTLLSLLLLFLLQKTQMQQPS